MNSDVKYKINFDLNYNNKLQRESLMPTDGKTNTRVDVVTLQ